MLIEEVARARMVPLDWLSEQFELSRGGERHNVRVMEGLRGFAVFLVFLVHYVTLVEPWVAGESVLHSVAAAVRMMGHTGVDLFFVLSGYLIYGSLIARKQPFLRFISRRVERIYPAFLTVFGLYIILSFVFPAESKIPSSAVAGAIYLAENILLLPGLFAIEPVITVAWSLSYEMFFYLIIPIGISILGLRRRTRGWRILFFLLLALVLVVSCAAYGGHVRLVMFLSGIVLYEVMAWSRLARWPQTVAGLALFAGLSVMLVPLAGSAGYAAKVALLSASFFVLCLSCFTQPSGWLSHVFSWTPIRWLGNMSYSYYLLHGLALKGYFLVLGMVLPVTHQGPLFFLALLVLMFAGSLVPTAVLFVLIERPFSLAGYIAHTGAPKIAKLHSPVETLETEASRPVS